MDGLQGGRQGRDEIHPWIKIDIAEILHLHGARSDGDAQRNEGLKVVGNDNFDWRELKAIIAKDGGIFIPTSGDTDDDDIDEKRNEILLPNLEVLHIVCKTCFYVQKPFLMWYARAGGLKMTPVV